ncbi:MAG TPA: HtaA domain-containing protein [Arthrobacter sp.]|nr:HtaA domain-containing protein [Arthrobacter sp.]
MCDSGLTWTVKKSFVRYIESMKDGHVAVADGALRLQDGSFHFPLASGTPRNGLAFGGSVHFTGHFGMLSLAISAPAVVSADDGLFLSIADDEEPGERRPFVILGKPGQYPGHVEFPSPALTPAGADLFFDNYRPGTLFDPIFVMPGLPGQADPKHQEVWHD